MKTWTSTNTVIGETTKTHCLQVAVVQAVVVAVAVAEAEMEAKICGKVGRYGERKLLQSSANAHTKKGDEQTCLI